MATASALDLGRQSYDRRAWKTAFECLSAADREAPLDPVDLERMGISAHLIGRHAESLEILTRVHQEWLSRGDTARAARSAIWHGLQLLTAGQPAQGNGWIARGRRLIDDGRRECAEQGYLLLPVALQAVAEGRQEDAGATFAQAAAIGDRFGDRDLTTLGRQGLGRSLINRGRIAEGVALLDEVMVAVTAGDVSPIVIGVVYCSVLEACYEMFDLWRAHEWTNALDAWCTSQPDLVPFRGHCMVRRAQILQLHGAWQDALGEAERACATLARGPAPGGIGAAYYQQGELHRLRGEFVKAEEAYRQAARTNRRPQPGLALLRLAQGQIDAAVAAITRLMDEAQDRRVRPPVLEACVEIMLAAGDAAAARAASDELSTLAADMSSRYLRALALRSNGAVLLAEGDARAALASLRAA
jgi:tetratricopeptide (TPR) repeat protein